MSSFAKFPRYGEAWADCSTCGFSFPMSQMTRHYKTKKLVDRKCADALTHQDFMEWLQRPVEHQSNTEQKVDQSGAIPGTVSPDVGYGGGGYGGGGYGR